MSILTCKKCKTPMNIPEEFIFKVEEYTHSCIYCDAQITLKPANCKSWHGFTWIDTEIASPLKPKASKARTISLLISLFNKFNSK